MLQVNQFTEMMLDLERIADASVESMFAVGCAQYDLTMNQLRILMELRKGGQYTVGELSGVLGILRGNMAAVCKKLEERRLLQRIRSKKDERVIFLGLTSKGEQVTGSILEQLQGKYETLFAAQEETAAQSILEGLKALYALLEQM